MIKKYLYVIPLVLVIALIVVSIGCGGGGETIASNADRFTGVWNGTIESVGRSDGGELVQMQMRMNNEFAGREEVQGGFMEWITFTIFWDGVLVFNGMIEAMPGGIWILNIYDSGTSYEMLGQFTGNASTGTWSMSTPYSVAPYQIDVWGTWNLTR